MKDYTLTVGLEVHAELATQTKMFCNSKNDTDEDCPNVNVCPICLGYPGTLPVINKEAIRSVLLLGRAVDGHLADYSEFDRKNYFYPDIPKGYQISQYKYPLVSGGTIDGISLTRIHLEEDTAKSAHTANGGAGDDKGDSLMDFNRAGVPLMELVTEPVIRTSAEAVNFAKELQLLLQYLGISNANMEKGEMRVEANISVSKTETFGTKVEVKNINSFRAVGKAIEFEFKRQCELIESKGKVVQETRGWDERKEETFSQRLKESAHDYRYFPDPDLPKLFIKSIPEFSEDALKGSLPELPRYKRERYKRDYKLKDDDIEIYIKDLGWGKFFESVAQILQEPALPAGRPALLQLASNYITTDLKKFIPAADFAEVVLMIEKGELSSRGAKDILKILQTDGGNPKDLAEQKNLIQISDREVLQKFVDEVLKEVPTRTGNSVMPIQFLVGQAMKKSGGRANPQMLQKMFEEILP